MVASTDPGWIQSAFNMLTGLFDRVGLQTNIRKTVGMVCRPFREAGEKSDKAYTWRITGEGRSFKGRQRYWVLCPECGNELAKGSLVTHRQSHHGAAKGEL